MTKKYKYSRKQLSKMWEFGEKSSVEIIEDDLLATVTEKECDHIFYWDEEDKIMVCQECGSEMISEPTPTTPNKVTPPQLCELKLPVYLFDNQLANEWARDITNHVNLLSQRVCKEK